MSKRKRIIQILGMLMAASMVVSPVQNVQAEENEEAANTIFINEIESSDIDGGNDWMEIINTGEADVDISGWYVTDDKGAERVDEESTYPLAEGTVLKAGEVMILEETVNFDFGLGKEDTVTLYDASSQSIDTYSWSGHAAGTYARVPGSTEFVDQAPTKGTTNVVEEQPDTGKNEGEESNPTPDTTNGQLALNEINSSPDDWVELMNIGTGVMDISGFEIRDNSDDHRWQFPTGTTIEAGALLVVKADNEGLIFDDSTDTYIQGVFDEAIGIGSGDSIRLYDKEGNLIDSHSWTEHANVNGDESASWGRYPDGTGSFVLMPETGGEANSWYVPSIVINEVESNGDATDWVEVYNAGTTDVDLSGWYLYDNDPTGHAADITPVAEGTTIAPGEFYVFDTNTHFTFGLGKADKVTIYNKDGNKVAEYAWESHAEGVYARIPDGTGEFVDFEISTKGKANVVTSPVAINEVQSNDPNEGPDWIELSNPTDADLDISGLVLKDDDDSHEYVIPEGTVIPANGFFVITENEFDFGLGKNDTVRLFENGMLIASTTWEGHTNPTWGLYPDVNGSEYQSTKEATPGAANKFAGIPDLIQWPGSGEVITYDNVSTFLEDSSGLDFHNGQLYAVDNGTGKFWILDVAEDGSLSFAKGFENGKTVNFINGSSKGPDTEGITVDGDGYVYLASERDNSNKGVNYNVILKADPNAEGTALTALQEWDLTASLPDVAANTGIEAVEWVSNAAVAGKLIDQNTNEAFDVENYPNATANGVFFVALEDNGHVYAYVLNADGSSVQISDIDPKLGGAMALDYDTYENVLWVVTDDGYGNVAAKVSFTGETAPAVVHVSAASGVDVALNNEGFAIAEANFTKDGQRPVYRFTDGVTSGALTIGSLACDYKEENNSDDNSNPDNDITETTKPDNSGSSDKDSSDSADDSSDTSKNDSSNTSNEKTASEQYIVSNAQTAAPSTGDTSNLYLWFVLALSCGTIALYFAGRKIR